MPYKTVSDLPPSVKDHLPVGAQKIFLGAFNNVFAKSGEESAFRIAWSVIKKHYKKDSTGKWVSNSHADRASVKPGHNKPSSIEDDTALPPDIIADKVVSESGLVFTPSQRGKLTEHLVEKAETIYANNESFRKQLNAKGNKGRDALYMFMRHWTPAWVGKNMRNDLEKLPHGFANGEAPRRDRANLQDTAATHNVKPTELMQKFWANQIKRGEKPEPVWAVVSVKSQQPVGSIIGWSVSKANAQKMLEKSEGKWKLELVKPDNEKGEYKYVFNAKKSDKGLTRIWVPSKHDKADTAAKISGEFYNRLKKECDDVLSKNKINPARVTNLRLAWEVFHAANAYWVYKDCDATDASIETALRKIFNIKNKDTANYTASLRPAVKHNGKLYKGKLGERHADVRNSHGIPHAQEMHGDDGFVDHMGRFLNRKKAGKYAHAHGLLNQQYEKYYKSGGDNFELHADMLKPVMEDVAMAKRMFYVQEMVAGKWYTITDNKGPKPVFREFTSRDEALEFSKRLTGYQHNRTRIVSKPAEKITKEDIAMTPAKKQANDARIRKAVHVFMKHLKAAHKKDKKKYTYDASHIPAVVEKMIVNLAKGTANVDSDAVRGAAEELGIDGNRSSWIHYLQSEHSLDTHAIGQILKDTAAFTPSTSNIRIPSVDTAEFGKRVREGAAHVAGKVAEGAKIGAEHAFYEAKSIPGGIKALGEDAVSYIKDLGQNIHEGLHNIGYRRSRPIGDAEELHTYSRPFTARHGDELHRVMSKHGFKRHENGKSWHKGKEHYVVHPHGTGHLLVKTRSF